MNRRTFLRTLLGLPIAAKVALSASEKAVVSTNYFPIKPDGGEPKVPVVFFSNPIGSHDWLFQCWSNRQPQYDYMCGPEQAKDLNEIFSRLYAQRKRRDELSARIRDSEGFVDMLNRIDQ